MGGWFLMLIGTPLVATVSALVAGVIGGLLEFVLNRREKIRIAAELTAPR
jgi:uncharacterized membrane protein YjjP (DUF1212 family)